MLSILNVHLTYQKYTETLILYISLYFQVTGPSATWDGKKELLDVDLFRHLKSFIHYIDNMQLLIKTKI